MLMDSSFALMSFSSDRTRGKIYEPINQCRVPRRSLSIGLLSQPQHLTRVDDIRELKVVQSNQQQPISINTMSKVE